MLPGAVPPPRKQNNVAEATFDKPATVKTLESSSKVRYDLTLSIPSIYIITMR